jgi:uncharacterized membrane protein YdjX (TVP38/TMEM64 family)
MTIEQAMKRSVWLRMGGAVAMLAALAATVILLPVKGHLVGFLEWVQGMGLWGPVCLAGLYVVACLFFIPGSLLTLGAGFLFGVVWGTSAVSLGSTLGATAAFLVGRTLARDWIEQKVSANRNFQAIDRAVVRQGFKIVLLTRLSPLFPFNLLNFAFGLTGVSVLDYVLASWIGMLPGTVMYVYLGSAAKSLADLAAGKAAGGVGQKVLFLVGLVVATVLAVLVTRIARSALKETVGRGSESLAAAHGDADD